MAAATSINFSLQAKDWETLVGIISQTADPDLLDIIFQLMKTYHTSVPATPNTSVQVTTTESTVIKLSTFMWGNTVYNITTDSGANPFGRIMAAIRAANNAADNYISTTLATNDANYANTATAIKKNGRKTLMILSYDNN